VSTRFSTWYRAHPTLPFSSREDGLPHRSALLVKAPRRTNLVASPTTPNLERLAQLLEADTLRVPIQDRYPLEQAGTALGALASAHTQGKLAITIT
jgi:NADPH:quinone reductase-like Zn-dependent oxidoreductase